MFDTLIGQDQIKRKLSFYLDGYKSTKISPFLMFNGSKGLGKTEFAKQYAKELKKPLLEINCSTIKNNQQFFEQIFIPVIMDNEITILFDECHALPKDLTMAFLTVFNTEEQSRKMFNWNDSHFEFNFEKQTYIFATTEPDKVFAPLMDRMTVVDFKPYTENELGQILTKRLDWVKFDGDVVNDIAGTLRGNARSAVKRSKEIEMYCESHNVSILTKKHWNDLCRMLAINPSGLTNSEIEILNILKLRGDCSLAMLSAATGLSRTAIQRDSEMYLLRKGLIKIDGLRKITDAGRAVLQSV